MSAEEPYRADAARVANFQGETGIYVRGLDADGNWSSLDLLHLDRPSLARWLHSRGGCNAWAENTLGLMLAHSEPLCDGPETAAAEEPTQVGAERLLELTSSVADQLDGLRGDLIASAYPDADAERLLVDLVARLREVSS